MLLCPWRVDPDMQNPLTGGLNEREDEFLEIQ